MDPTRLFTSFANTVSRYTGRPLIFVLCIVSVAAWAVTGPLFGFSDTWQLVINTSTTIITFLMVFLIQNTQNRDNAALQAKLDELIRVTNAKNGFIGIEKLTDKELEQILDDFERDGHATSLGRKSEIIQKKATEARAKQRRAQGKTKRQTPPTKLTRKIKTRAELAQPPRGRYPRERLFDVKGPSMADLEAFRTEVREWLAANYPAELKDPAAQLDEEAIWGGRKYQGATDPISVWRTRMAERGWTAPTWPKELGGGGLNPQEAAVLNQELTKGGYRLPLASFGIWMLGPVLLEYANDEQKKRFIPEIVRGDIRWCQGYSEPGAGSDLAGLQTKAEDKGDHYLVNGQKVWTSYADKADWIFALVRTDTSKKHEGISFLLIDMASPGVEPKPIRLISGSSPFCETFFNDVKVPKEQLVGRLNGGWEIAKRLLQYERQNISGSMVSASSSGGGGMGQAAGSLEDVAREFVGVGPDGRLLDADLRARITINKMGSHAFQLTQRRLAAEAKGGGPSAATSIIKYAGASLGIERNELLVEAMGLRGLGWEGDNFTPRELGQTRAWLRSKGNSIEGGTSEVNLNVVAKQVLGLREHQ